MERLQSRAHELSSFAEAGLTYDDFKSMGLENVVSQEDVEAAHRRAEERRNTAAQASQAAAEGGERKAKGGKAKSGKPKTAKSKSKPGPAPAPATRAPATPVTPVTPVTTRPRMPDPIVNEALPEPQTAGPELDLTTDTVAAAPAAPGEPTGEANAPPEAFPEPLAAATMTAATPDPEAPADPGPSDRKG